MSEKIKQINEYKWEIPVAYKTGMRVPGIIYADKELMKHIINDKSIEQVANAAFLPGIVKASLAMPDMHFGYGLPIGGVVATNVENGVISPGGVGFDINCGVRLVRTNLTKEEIEKGDTLRLLVNALFSNVPAGLGSTSKIRLSSKDQKTVLVKGAKWAVENGFGVAEDLEHTEANGCLEGANPDLVSDKAYERGKRQQGTLGSGNHFMEIQYVQEIYDQKAATAFGLQKGQITVMIHSGSRGFGHQICTDYLVTMEKAVRKYGFQLPDRQLACAPINSPEGQRYLAAMKCAANYAWANRQCLMYWLREVLEKVLNRSPKDLGVSLVYDVAHNIVKVEEHTVDGKKMKLAVHRKGATRAFPAQHPEIPEAYREVGQPVIIPGDMGTNSYVLVGTPKAMEETFGSTCHGAGRLLSRHAAIRSAKGRAIERELGDEGIIVRARGRLTLKEEMPEAYKNITEVINVVHNAGIAHRVAKLKPMGVIKG